ncbi:putative trna exportin protein [Lasiodiplodia theobromae]|nr:putative trna exportin protein [Lasiodiplodia theobromae]
MPRFHFGLIRSKTHILHLEEKHVHRSTLIASPGLADQSVSTYDNDLAEAVAKLVNTTMFDIVKVLDTDSADDGTKQQANDLLGASVKAPG